MDRDQAYAVLGTAIRNSRERQGLTRPDVVARIQQAGGSVTIRSILSLEKGVVPKQRAKLPSTEPVVAALGWRAGWADRILAGEDPEVVLAPLTDELAALRIEQSQVTAARPEASREEVLGMLPDIYGFSRKAEALGADSRIRAEFDRLADELVWSIPATAEPTAEYGLAAARPHAEGEGVPADDARRIASAMDGE
ncbi:hypothetical protein [Streptomyces qinglanensis]|uniref:Uncharacterized protein n=1 Tax=Streptomyces qinglanensis TaxID=943816 RepID=A0A1H9U581_9ACTN|nr:hypothetical protein [Streptomyces qinglanensis]SES04482.1 hypothetical protein SAMN05421870_107337 [Streptomyces qinglanensis]